MDARWFSDPIFQSLVSKRCTTKVIDVLLQVLQQAADRTRLLNHPFTESLALLTLLRSEINVAQAALKEMQVDSEGLGRRLDRLLNRCDRVNYRSQEQVADDLAHSYQEVAATIWDLVERGKREAGTLGNDWVGTEHLLLAIIQTADACLSSILAGAGVSLEAARRAIHKVLYS